MAHPHDSTSHYGARIFKALLLAALIGFGWAWVEHKTDARQELQNLPNAVKQLWTETTRPEEPGSEHSTPHDAATTRKDPPAPTPAPHPPSPSDPPPPTPRTKLYSEAEMADLFKILDEHLRRGRLFEAREKLIGTVRSRIPPSSYETFHAYDLRITTYYALLQETTKGGTIEMPQLTQIFVKGGGKLVVKILSENSEAYFYETITAIRSKILKTQVESTRKLDSGYSYAEVIFELKRQCDYRGVTLIESQPDLYREKPGRQLTALQFFDLADFCARNGANDKLCPLFDEALKRDSNLLTTVHENKADRMVEVLLYFLQIKSTNDANLTLNILRKRYHDTQAYRERVAADAELLAILEGKTAPKPADPVAVAPHRPEPKPEPAPEPKPAPAPELEPVEPPKPEPEPAPAPPPSEPDTASMPQDAPTKVLVLVKKGDEIYAEAMQHVYNSTPTANPTGFVQENKKALDLFVKALQEYFNPAQELYAKDVPVPQALLNRMNDTQTNIKMCRLRARRK